MGKDKKEKKEKKDKKRKRDRDEDDDDRKRRDQGAKLAAKVVSHLKKKSAAAPAEGAADGPFVWGKKIEKDLQSGKDVREFSKKAERKRQEERAVEIEKVKKRREEREAEKARMEEELNFIQRERAIAEGVELDKKEEQFHLDQAKMRTAQRLQEGRAKPIDVIAKNLHLAEEYEVEAEEPYKVFGGLTLQEIRELVADIKEFQELDVYEEEHVRFWRAMVVVADHELAEATRQEEIDRARVRGLPAPAHIREAGLHGSVDADVQALIAGKSLAELEELEAGISGAVEEGAGDPEYYSAVLSRLAVEKARAVLRHIHSRLLQSYLDALQAAQDPADIAEAMGWNREGQQNGAAAGKASVEEEAAPAVGALEEQAAPPEPEPEPEPEAAFSDEESEEEREENVGQWSPPPVEAASIGGQDVVPEDDDKRLLDLLRAQMKFKAASQFGAAVALAAAQGVGNDADRSYQKMISDQGGHGVHPMFRNIADAAPQRGEVAFRGGAVATAGSAPPEDSSEQMAAFRAQATRLMGDAREQGDIAFGGEVALPSDSQVYWWHDKYKPRKAKYFNRVHTGYEWNKYNQTHYDHDNPPPKVVQGYKFNIFYPDLIDKDEAPTYSTAKDPTDTEGSTCILRIHAGPPYEDLAFRIVNKEWEYSHKKGFKCTFERGIFHLYFNFKRARYRR